MIWTIGQFPELDHLEPKQRAALLARVPWWTYPLLIAGSLIQGMLLGGIVLAYLLAFTGVNEVSVFSGIVVAFVGWIAFYLYRLGRVRADMRRTLADAFHGERPPFCLKCGYDLRATDAERCPECGSALGTSAEARPPA